MLWFRASFSALVLALILALASPQARASEADTVRQIGAALNAAAVQVESDPAAGKAALLAVLDQWFALGSMAASALPEGYRDQATPAYMAAYRTYIAERFAAQVLRSGSGEIDPIGERALGPLTVVGAKVMENGQSRGMVEFMISRKGGASRVVNMTAEGILVTAQQQKDFLPILMSGGMPGLIAFLRGDA